MSQVQLDGRHVEVHDTGGAGPPLLCSADGDPSSFASLVRTLQRTHRVLAWDVAAGQGDRPVGWRAANDLLDLLDALGIERTILVGAGFGGEVSLRAALLAPDRIRALVLIATGIPADDPDQLTDRILEIDAPTLLVRGEQDDVATDQAVAPLRGELFDLRGEVVVPHAGGDPHVTHPEVVDPAILDFVRGLPA